MTSNSLPDPYQGLSTWVIVPEEAEIARFAPLREWVRLTEGRIFFKQEDAFRHGRAGEQLVQLPDQAEFEPTIEWYSWAYELMNGIEALAELRQHGLLTYYPPPPPAAAQQVHTLFEDLVGRFWSDGLLYVARSQGLCDTLQQLELLPIDQYD